jgi:hypothetical protein
MANISCRTWNHIVRHHQHCVSLLVIAGWSLLAAEPGVILYVTTSRIFFSVLAGWSISAA